MGKIRLVRKNYGDETGISDRSFALEFSFARASTTQSKKTVSGQSQFFLW